MWRKVCLLKVFVVLVVLGGVVWFWNFKFFVLSIFEVIYMFMLWGVERFDFECFYDGVDFGYIVLIEVDDLVLICEMLDFWLLIDLVFELFDVYVVCFLVLCCIYYWNNGVDLVNLVVLLCRMVIYF